MKGLRILTAIACMGAMLAAGPAFAAGPPEGIRDAVEQIDRSGMLLQAAERALQAGVPAEDLGVILTRSRDRAMAAEQVRELLDAATRAGAQGLPLRPVLDRIEQGLAKGAPAERIAAASRRLVGNLAVAAPMIDDLARQGLDRTGGQEREDAIEGVARALEQSVPKEVLADIGGSAREHGRSLAQFDRAVRCLTLFVGSGMPADDAGRMVRETVAHRYTERDYARLERGVGEMLRQGRPMSEVFDAAEHDLMQRRGRGDGRSGSGSRDRIPGSGRESGGRGGRSR